VSLEVLTFGCRLNVSESETVRRHAEAAGLDDTVIVNSCAVTGEAVRKAQQAIRRLKRERPTARVVVTGCAAQTEPETFAEMHEVDRVLGNHAKLSAGAWVETKRALDFGVGDEEKIRIDDLDSVRETALHLVDGFDGHVRAFVQVQNGCDHRCTFCIIPFGRGPSRSVPMGEIVEQVRRLVENKYREVVLTGVDLTAWGLDLPGRPRLGALVRTILRHVPELARLRISSLDPVEVDDDLLRAIAEEERLMPHLHLSLQHGDDLMLKRMKRRHSRADAIRFCNEARRLRPDILFGADLIAGFPTESETHFRNSALARRRLRTHVPACLSVFAAQRHARRAHAATRTHGREGTRGAAAEQGRDDVAPALRVGNRPPPERAGGRRWHGRPQRTFRARGIRTLRAARDDP
jgi:threonylcarbamoyladenosine tRNA methylthiotransferase MtaB